MEKFRPLISNQRNKTGLYYFCILVLQTKGSNLHPLIPQTRIQNIIKGYSII